MSAALLCSFLLLLLLPLLPFAGTANYTTKHVGMKAERQFVPPNSLR
jgi:hypothetical protein